jgi:peptidoglycan biosynthesis protein MviN/MurJ (putative lipid II flippase)
VALRNGPIFVRLGLIGSVLNVVGNVALAPWLGLRGIALATSLTSVVLAAISLLALQGRAQQRKPTFHEREFRS